MSGAPEVGRERAGADALERARAGDPVALARLLVSIPSVNPVLEPGGAGEADVARAAARLLRAWGLEVEVREVAPGRPNVLARLPGTGPSLLLNGHLDTVGVAGMTVDPFGATLTDSRLTGRGACDMKGGVAAILAAAHRLSTEDPASHAPLLVALTADEEHASLGMERLVEEPLGAAMAIVCEPTALTVMPAHKGFVWIRGSFRGRAAHGSRPELGVDAIRHAALWLARLEALRARYGATAPHALLGRPSFHAGTIRGGSAASVYPDGCELVVECRTLPGTSPSAVLEDFRRALDELRAGDPTIEADIEVALERPGSDVPADAPVVRALLAALERLGRPAELRGMSAWVDAAFLNRAGIPAVCFGPGDIEQAHTADEWIDTEEIRVCADVLVEVARDLARATSR